MSAETESSSNFIVARVEEDLRQGTYGGRVATRFPPEPNGFLTLGHLKAITLSFGIAEAYDGTCNLRFDDTNPETEDTTFAEAIERDIRWMGFEPARVVYASDYFEQLYQWAEKLIQDGKAYVDDSSLEQMRALRGTVTEPGTPSPGRSRSVEDNLDLFRRMRAGEFEDGAMVLRARIDLAHPNMKMRDPLMYRIRHAHHWRTGDTWCIYPMYDWAHGQSDAIEGITHSLCSLEFENNRELYDWFLEALGTETLGVDHPPQQLEFARLNMTYSVMSKRLFRRLVEEGRVDGWDDPRLTTVSGMRRRGYTPTMLRGFIDRIGMAKANSTVDLGLLEHVVRDELNHRAPRRMAVLDPLPVEISNWPEEELRELDAPDFPHDVGLPGSRSVPFGRRLLIERADFAVDPPKGFRRLVPGGEVRLRYGWVMRCDEVLTEGDAVVGLKCTIDEQTLGRNPDRKIGGTIHWVHAASAVHVKTRLYDRLFRVPEPGASGDLLDDLNPDSLTVVTAHAEPAVGALGPAEHVQLERQGYFFRDPYDGALVLNRTVSLKDSWGRASAAPEPARVVDEGPSGEEAAALNEEARRRQVEAFLEAHPDLRSRYEALVDAGADEVEVRTVLERDALRGLLDGASDGRGVAFQVAAVSWLVNVVAAELKGTDDHKLTAAALAELLELVEAGTITKGVAKDLTAELVTDGGSARALVEQRGLAVVGEDALGAEVDAVLAGLPDEVERYRGGDRKLFGFFIGQVMKATGGRAKPQQVQQLLKDRLG